MEERGIAPIRERLDEVLTVATTRDAVPGHGRGPAEGANGVVAPYVDTDARQSDRYLVYLEQGGLGLPDESYYREEKYEDIRAAYVAHIAAMLVLAGVGGADEARRSSTWRPGWPPATGTASAAATWWRPTPSSTTPGWPTWHPPSTGRRGWTGSGRTRRASTRSSSGSRRTCTAMAEQVRDTDLADWRTWLAWHVVRSSAPYLTAPVVEENFAFYQRTLTGVPEQRPRWKRGVALVEAALGEAVGKLYVARHFPPAAKAADEGAGREPHRGLPRGHRGARLDERGDQARRPWTKLAKFTPKIGYPDKWRDYSELEIIAATTWSATSARAPPRSRPPATSPSSASRSTATSGA